MTDKRHMQGTAAEPAEGLAADLAAMNRRGALGGLAALGGLLVLGASAHGAAAADCPVPAAETNGPYPADGSNALNGQTVNVLTQEGIQRHDLRGSFAGQSGTAPGLPLSIEIRLSNAADGACAPLPGLAVYLWHCDAEGRYSIYDLPEVNYLRGLGVSDAGGIVRFQTIFPGCYDGRWPHFHFEVFGSAEAAVNGAAPVLTSQFALPEAVCASVYASTPGYETSKDNLTRQSLTRDMVFGDNSEAEMAAMMMIVKRDPMAGASATAVVGLVV